MAYNGCMEVRPLPVLGEGAGAQYDVVVYGGGFARVAAAGGAARLRPGARVLLIAPESGFAVGGLFTAGGQNFWHVRYWRGETPQAGSFARWFAALGNLLLPGYACGTAAMAFTALRVGPNLCVLGDAAGDAAAQALADAIDPVDFTAEHIAAVQENLRRLGARLDK